MLSNIKPQNNVKTDPDSASNPGLSMMSLARTFPRFQTRPHPNQAPNPLQAIYFCPFFKVKCRPKLQADGLRQPLRRMLRNGNAPRLTGNKSTGLETSTGQKKTQLFLKDGLEILLKEKAWM